MQWVDSEKGIKKQMKGEKYSYAISRTLLCKRDGICNCLGFCSSLNKDIHLDGVYTCSAVPHSIHVDRTVNLAEQNCAEV